MRQFRQWGKRFADGYVRFVEREGFFVIIICCVAVIAGSAVWTKANMPAPLAAPALPTEEALSAAELLQQSLQDAVRPTAAPTPAPVAYRPPVAAVSVVTEFDAARLKQSAVTGIWRVHDAVDLAAAQGEIICAMADGTVISARENTTKGACVVIDHGEGVIAEYAGMTALSAVRDGDPVDAGQTLGFAGNGMLDETDLPAHLHLRVTRDDAAIDPLLLWD